LQPPLFVALSSAFQQKDCDIFEKKSIFCNVKRSKGHNVSRLVLQKGENVTSSKKCII